MGNRLVAVGLDHVTHNHTTPAELGARVVVVATTVGNKRHTIKRGIFPVCLEDHYTITQIILGGSGNKPHETAEARPKQ